MNGHELDSSECDWEPAIEGDAVLIDTVPSTSTLSERLRQRIIRHGLITFCDWMEAALYDEQDGYYRRANSRPWGREGDYRTSPERSALFASTFARYFASLYEQLGQPANWTIAEAGAGDGSFALGVLTTLELFFPSVFAATSYVIDEAGARHSVTGQLGVFGDRVAFGRLTEIDLNPGIIFSNELFDAFPVHRVTSKNGELHEFYVGVGSKGEFTWIVGTLSTKRLAQYFEEQGINLIEGQVTEVNLAIEDWLKSASERLTRGYLITVDYGLEAADLDSASARMNGTLRSYKRHAIGENLLAQPGEQDLTSSVNWSFVKEIGERHGLETIDFQRQDKFLLSAGLLTQLELESEHAANEAEKMRLSTGAREMILPDGMAASFQVLVQKKKTQP